MTPAFDMVVTSLRFQNSQCHHGICESCDDPFDAGQPLVRTRRAAAERSG